MERPIKGAINPEYSSRIANSVSPLEAGVSVNVRSPLKSPRGMPPVQTMRRGDSNAVTLTGNALRGFTFGRTVTRSPGAILPSIFSTVLFQRVYSAASVNNDQMRSGVERIDTLTEKFFIRKTILALAASESQRTQMCVRLIPTPQASAPR